MQQESTPVTIVQIAPERAAQEISMIDVAVASFGVTGLIMGAALIAGLLAGGGYIWFRSKRAVSTIEERGNTANLFRATD